MTSLLDQNKVECINPSLIIDPSDEMDRKSKEVCRFREGYMGENKRYVGYGGWYNAINIWDLAKQRIIFSKKFQVNIEIYKMSIFEDVRSFRNSEFPDKVV